MVIADKKPVTIRRGEDGNFILDAALIARCFGWAESQLRDTMRNERVTSLVERGEGCDSGRWRLTLRCGNRRWQAIVTDEGAVVSENLDFISLKTAPENA